MSATRRRVVTGVALVLASALFTGVSGAAPSTVDSAGALPAPTGPHQIGKVDLHLVDRGRPDPWVPSTPYRENMVSVWYPARDTERFPLAKYLPDSVITEIGKPDPLGGDSAAPASSDALRALKSHARVGAPVANRGVARPVILYSPLHYHPRALTTVLVEELVSRGYIVVTTDHTHESLAVDFPGGRTEKLKDPARPDPSDPVRFADMLRKSVDARVKDNRFTLDQLAALNAGHNPDASGQPLPKGLRGAFDLSKVGMFGTNMGTDTVLQTAYEDPRVDAVAALSGGNSIADPRYPVYANGLSKPVLLVSDTLPDPQNHVQDPNWRRFWPLLRGEKLNLQLKGSFDASFNDYQLLAELIKPGAGMPPGAIGEKESIAAQRAYLSAFFDKHLRCRDTGLLDGPSPKYPAVSFIG